MQIFPTAAQSILQGFFSLGAWGDRRVAPPPRSSEDQRKADLMCLAKAENKRLRKNAKRLKDHTR